MDKFLNVIGGVQSTSKLAPSLEAQGELKLDVRFRQV
jgi:hypothetical protein